MFLWHRCRKSVAKNRSLPWVRSRVCSTDLYSSAVNNISLLPKRKGTYEGVILCFSIFRKCRECRTGRTENTYSFVRPRPRSLRRGEKERVWTEGVETRKKRRASLYNMQCKRLDSARADWSVRVTYSDFRAGCCTNLTFVLRLAEKLTSRKFPGPGGEVLYCNISTSEERRRSNSSALWVEMKNLKESSMWTLYLYFH